MSSNLLTPRQVSNFRFTRVIRHGAYQTSAQKIDGIEGDVNRAARVLYPDLGLPSDGFLTLEEFLHGNNRALNVSGFSSGGALGTERLGGLIYENVFPQSVVFGAGAGYLGGLTSIMGEGVGNRAIPAIQSMAAAEWLAEGATASNSQGFALTTRLATPHRVVAKINFSNQLIAQVSDESEALVRRIIGLGLASALDGAALAGTGGAMPTGVVNSDAVNVVSMGTDGAAGTLAKLVEAEQAPLTAKVKPTAPGYCLSVNTRAKLKNTQKFTGASVGLLESVGTSDQLCGIRAFTTAHLSDSLKKGSGSDLGSLVYGADWTAMTITSWGGLHIVADPFSRALYDETVVTTTMLCDAVLLYPKAFTVIRDLVNT